MGERLDGYLAHRGHGTRSTAHALVRRGLVAIEGVVCRDPSQHITEGQRVTLNGVEIVTGPSAATLIMHKPLGCACSHDPREAPLLEALYPPELRHLPIEPAGRLDRETSGLLIVTTEGELIHQLTNPRRKLPKRYRIGYTGVLSSQAAERCAKGMVIDGDPRPTLPARLTLIDAIGSLAQALLILHEGRYHQVRRMIAALGGEVVTLHRDRVGRLELPSDLAPGQSRELTARDRVLLLSGADEPLVTTVTLGLRD